MLSSFGDLYAVEANQHHYSDVIISPMASQIASLTIVYSTVYSGADQRKHTSSESLAFVRWIHRCPVNSPHKGSVTRKMFPCDDVIKIRVHCRVIEWGTWNVVWETIGNIHIPKESSTGIFIGIASSFFHCILCNYIYKWRTVWNNKREPTN